MDLQHQQDRQAKTLRFLTLVEKQCRLAGGKHTLSSEAYLKIVNDCYRTVYGTDADADALRAATGG